MHWRLKMNYATENIRNLAMIGQQGSGKTTLLEAILHQSGVITKMGNIKESNTVCDYDWLEKERGFTLNCSLVHTNWKEKKINLMDNPGFPELIEKARSTLRVVEIALINVSPDTLSGNDVRRCMNYIKQQNLPRLIFLNKIDTEQTDLTTIFDKIEQQLNVKPLPLTYPIFKDKKLVGLVDLIEMKGKLYNQQKIEPIEIPEELKSTVDELREKIMEAVAELNDELIEKYLEQGNLTLDEIKQGLKKGIADAKVTPLLLGSALHAIGIDAILDIVTTFFPSPGWRKVIACETPEKKDEQKEIDLSTTKSFCAQVFLTLFEAHLGELSFIKVFSGTLSSGSTIYNTSKQEEEKIGQIYLMLGNKREETPQLVAGDIGALTKLKNAATGDTFASHDNPIVLNPIHFPATNTSTALKPKEEKDEQRLSVALSRLTKVDPLLKVEVDKESGQTILSGMGEVHLEIIINRLNKDFSVTVETEEPDIPFRETITAQAEAQGKYKRQSGGRGQYGDAWLRIKPLPRGEGFKFVDEIKGGVVPARFIPSIEKGLKEAIKKGNLANYSIVDIEVALFDGSYHAVDSSDIAFQIAASMGLRKAIDAANPILLEPIMELEVETPSEYMGDISGDLSSRRGKILEVQPLGGLEKIKALVPLTNMRKYSTTLRSITQGRGVFTQKFSHYEKVPDEVTQKIIEARKQKKEN